MTAPHLNPTPTKETARPTGRSDRAAAEVSATHWEPSLARSQQNGTRWLPNPGSCAGQLLLELDLPDEMLEGVELQQWLVMAREVRA